MATLDNSQSQICIHVSLGITYSDVKERASALTTGWTMPRRTTDSFIFIKIFHMSN